MLLMAGNRFTVSTTLAVISLNRPTAGVHEALTDLVLLLLACVSGVQCPLLPALINGEVLRSEDRFVNATLRYQCNSGFRLDGASELICSESGEWSAPMPECVGM